jgi:xylulokinase
MVRSVLEGVAFGLRDIAQIILELGSSPEQILVSGGAANSGVWRQIIADTLGLDVFTMSASAYGGAFGAALIAGTAVGAWSSLGEAVEVLRVETEDRPIDRNVAVYNRLFPAYRDLYASLRSVFGRISSLQL